MAQLAIKGHSTRGKEVLQLLEMLGGRNKYNLTGNDDCIYYVIEHCEIIGGEYISSNEPYTFFTLEEFEEKFPYKVGDKVVIENYKQIFEILSVRWCAERNIIMHQTSNGWYSVNDLQPYEKEYYCQVIGNETSSNGVNTSASSINEETMEEDKGNISDGYHTFNELYEYRLLYNASLFNELAKQGLYDVHKSRLHSNGEIPFGDSNWFIVMAELPTGQISNHYEMKDWDLFQIPEKAKANVWDGHSPQDVANRLREFLTPKSIYPKDYKECEASGFSSNPVIVAMAQGVCMNSFAKLIVIRNTYWEIAGKKMGLGKPWEYDMSKDEFVYAIVYQCKRIHKCEVRYKNHILAFPTKEMRDAFYENFKELIESVKELL